MELLTKFNDVATDGQPDAIQYLIKDSIELEIRKQDPILNPDTVTIILVEAEIYSIKSIFNTLEMKFGANLRDAFSDADRTSIKKLHFQVTDPCDSFAKLGRDMTVFTNKF